MLAQEIYEVLLGNEAQVQEKPLQAVSALLAQAPELAQILCAHLAASYEEILESFLSRCRFH